MTPQQIRDSWNAQADEYNQWSELDEDEKLGWAYKSAALQPAQPAEPVAWMHRLDWIGERRGIFTGSFDLSPGFGIPLYEAPPPAQQPLATDYWQLIREDFERRMKAAGVRQIAISRLDSGVYFSPAVEEDWETEKRKYASPAQQPLSEREIELIDGMIEWYLARASHCDTTINRQDGNHKMTEKQKGLGMELVTLFQKLKAAHGIGGEK